MTPKPIDGIQGKNVKLYILILTYEHMSLLFSWIYWFRLFYCNSYAPEDIEGGIKTESKPHLDLRTVLV